MEVLLVTHNYLLKVLLSNTSIYDPLLKTKSL
jgi:hypothetical protein